MTNDQDDLIRDRAYAIWEAEGCPDGRQDQHWEQAAAELAQVRDEATQQDEPTLDPAEVASQPTTADTTSATPVADTAAAPVRRPRKTAEPAPAAAKGRRKKGA